MVYHLQEGALYPLEIEREEPQDDEAQMTYRRVGHELLDVRLDHRDQSAIDDPDDPQGQDPG